MAKATIHKLVIFRAAKLRDEDFAAFSELLRHRFAAEVKMPIDVLPVAHADEEKPSHKGFVLTGLKLPDLEKLAEFEPAVTYSTVLTLEATDDAAIEKALRAVGLRIHPLVER